MRASLRHRYEKEKNYDGMIDNALMVDVKVIFIHVIIVHVWLLLRKYPAFCFDKKWEVDAIQDGTLEKFK